MARSLRAVVAASLACGAASIVMTQQPPPGDARRVAEGAVMQWSEVRLGPPMLESKACAIEYWKSNNSEWQENDPPVFPHAGIGARRRMYAIDDMEYQLFLPLNWGNDTKTPFPVVVYLHGHAERKWSVLNTQGLARLLARNMSNAFDNRSCWCLDSQFATTTVTTESSSRAQTMSSPLADCDFPDTFNAIAIFPQGWTKQETPGWTADMLGKVETIVQKTMLKFNGDADKVVVTGWAEGGQGAIDLVAAAPNKYSALIVTDAPSATSKPGLATKPVWVTSDAADAPETLQGAEGKLTRYSSTPGPADPELNTNYKHSADLIYRDPELWEWAFGKKSCGGPQDCGREAWGMPAHEYVHLGQ